jgi:HEAT repeat protein
VPLLVAALKDEDSDVQDAAAEALHKIDPAAARQAGVP